MENKRLLYLVQHSNKEMFKIGIGTDNGRFRDLDRDYSIDWTSSIYFKGENQDITKMERILHKLFYEYRLDKQNGTGGTEWFSTKCLESTVEAVLFNVNNSGFSIDLQPQEIILNEYISESKEVSKIEKETKLNLNWNQEKQRIFSKYPQSIIDKWLMLDNMKPSQEIVNEMNRLIPEFYCFLKPSSLIHGQLYKSDKSFYKLNPVQFDTFNFMMYKVKETLMKELGSTENLINIIKNDYDKFEELIDKHWYEITWKELFLFIDRLDKKHNVIDDALEELTSVKIKTNVFDKNKNLGQTTFNLIRKYTRFKHKIKYKIEPELFQMVMLQKPWLDETFVLLKLKVQAQNLKTVGSKRLYEFLKDWEFAKTVTTKFDNILIIMNLDDTVQSNKTYAMVNRNHLKKAVEEINEKSDILVSYEPIKEKLHGERIQVTKIKFNIKKQDESRLKELGLIEEPITSLPFYNKSKSKLDKLIKNGYNVVDEDMWIKTDIKKNEERYDAEIGLDKWIKETSQDEKNEIYKILADSIIDCEDPMVIIEDYHIVGLFSKDILTKNPQETVKLLNSIIDTANDSLNSER